jgi:ring-1,2-phenylacetyl-CoA epoxidase subunit PaaE
MAFGLFKKKKKNTDNRYFTVKVKEVVHIAKDAVNLVFEKPDDFEYEPGQFITVISEVDGKKIRRAYSLCTTPFEDQFPAVTVKRVPDGLMSNFLNEKVKAGDQLEIMEPMGMFTTSYDASNNRSAVFFGGGSGITPLISIIRSILLKEPNSKLTLVYANRSDEYIIFKDLISQLKDQYPNNFNVVHVLESGEADYSGRLTNAMIATICEKVNCVSDTEFYICGPQPMMDITFSGLEEAGYLKEKIRMESFEAGKTSPELMGEEQSTSGKSEVTILLDGEEHVVMVKKGASILDTALDADLDMPYSCQSGLCTACRGKCLEGEISTNEAEGLSEEELDEGFVLCCVGRPISDKIKVEIG